MTKPEGWTFGEMTAAIGTAIGFGEYLGKMAALDVMGLDDDNDKRVDLGLSEALEDSDRSPEVKAKFVWTLMESIRSIRSELDKVETTIVGLGLASQPLPDPDTVVIPDTVPVDWS